MLGLETTFRKNKELPGFFNYLGWCSWNAFYKDITEDKVKAKLAEFKAKKVPLKWIVLDDGWQKFSSDIKLTALTEDVEKFPIGLKSAIKNIKSEYGIEKVGIWHSLACYWNGIEKNSKAYDCLAPYLVEHNGLLLPSLEKESNTSFWKYYYEWMCMQGIDFVKVDNQSESFYQYHGIGPTSEVNKKVHDLIEENILKYFDNAAINCMGMRLIDMWHRKNTALNRNSDDFYPDKENGFITHAICNAYNSLYHAPFFFQDWDMWWTNHRDNYKNQLLRAISGSPVYISDKINETNKSLLDSLMNEDGFLFKCDGIALPSEDCLFSDPRKKGIFKLINTHKKRKYTALYNLNISRDIQLETFDLFSLLNLGKGKYIIRDCYYNIYKEAENNYMVDIVLSWEEIALFEAIPIENDLAVIGLENKLISSATYEEKDGIFKVLGNGDFCLFAEQPIRIRKNGVSEKITNKRLNKIPVQKDDVIEVIYE